MANKVYDIVLKKILEMLDNQQVPWRANWLLKNFNGATKREYNGINKLLLSWEAIRNGYTAPIWFSFKQIKELGGSVKKGSKASFVIFSKVVEKAEEDEEENKRYFLLRYYNVFNLDSVQGIDKTKYLNQFNEENTEVETLVEKIKNTGVKIKKQGFQPCYNPTTDTIEIPAKEIFASQEAYYSAFFHEATHSTGHKDRLSRKGVVDVNMFDKERYSYEELVAEIGSAFLMAEAGLKVQYENTTAYLQGWSKFLRENKKAILQASSDAKKAVEYILQK
jgi:antirestriction protein ArdC